MSAPDPTPAQSAATPEAQAALSAAPKLDQQLCFALHAASRLVTRAYRPLLAPLGLTYTQYVAMLVLWEDAAASRETTVKSLGARLFLDSGTLTPLLKRMQTLGFLDRQRSSADERVVNIVLTADGAALAEKAADIPAQLMCLAGGSTGVDADAVQQLRDGARRLAALLAEAP